MRFGTEPGTGKENRTSPGLRPQARGSPGFLKNQNLEPSVNQECDNALRIICGGRRGISGWAPRGVYVICRPSCHQREKREVHVGQRRVCVTDLLTDLWCVCIARRREEARWTHLWHIRDKK